MDGRAIGVFDSGLGGLTVVGKIAALLPGEDIVYFGDTGRVPYGNRSAGTIEQYAVEDERFLLKQGVKLVVAACGTVSSVAPYTGDILPVPFVGVVEPAARAAAAATRNGRVGVIGTGATIKSGAFRRGVEKYRPGARVFDEACPLFVPLVEAGWIDRNDAVTVETARRYLAPLVAERIDTLIMGCTHYPVLRDIIADIMGEGVTLINPGEWVAKRVKAVLGERDMLCGRDAGGKCRFYVSDLTDTFGEVARVLLGYPVEGDVKKIDLRDYGENA